MNKEVSGLMTKGFAYFAPERRRCFWHYSAINSSGFKSLQEVKACSLTCEGPRAGRLRSAASLNQWRIPQI